MEYKLRERRTELFSFLVLSLVPVKISDRGRSMMLSFKDNPLPSHVIHNPVLFTQLKMPQWNMYYIQLLIVP